MRLLRLNSLVKRAFGRPRPSNATMSAVQTTRPQILARFRPLSAAEGSEKCVILADNTVQLSAGDSCHVFTYDTVHNESSTQADVFQSVENVVHSASEGYDSTIIAYGQTGSGKTHTLLSGVASNEEEGLVSRATEALFSTLRKTEDEFQVSVSVTEIYCERIRDLLDCAQDNLQIGTDRRTGSNSALPEAASVPISSSADLHRIIAPALAGRVVAKTAMNAGSSRSHCIVILNIRRQWPDGRITHCRLMLSDLAGSERQKMTAAEGLTLEEGKQINKSLSALSNVVQALTAGSRPSHVPYRDSKLTRLLQDALGGAGQTVIIICCSPAIRNAQETLSTLRFGARAQGIVNTMQVASAQNRGNDCEAALKKAQAEAEQLRAEAGHWRQLAEGRIDKRVPQIVALLQFGLFVAYLIAESYLASFAVLTGAPGSSS